MSELNLFSVLGIETKEVFHSKILAFLLAPNGKFKSGSSESEYFNCSHNCKSKFLINFLERTDLKNGYKKFDNAEVIVEADAGEYGRIDILIKINKNYWIAIENKIHAGDQKEQLQRYKKYLEESVDNFALLYLTLDGRDPSNSSKGNLIKNEDFFCIGYNEHINLWLAECIKGKHKGTLLKSMLQNYKSLINDLTDEYQKADEIIEKKEFDVTDGSNSKIYNKLVYPYVITELIGDAEVFDSKGEFYPDGNSFYIWLNWGKKNGRETHKIEYDLCFTLSGGCVTGYLVKIDRTDSEHEKWQKLSNNEECKKWIGWNSKEYYKYGPESIKSFIEKVKNNDEDLKDTIDNMKKMLIN